MSFEVIRFYSHYQNSRDRPFARPPARLHPPGYYYSFVPKLKIAVLYHLPALGQFRVPTVMENPEKSWKKVVMESHEKVMENSKNSEFHGNLFARKKVMEKSWKSVVQIRLIVFLLCCDQCGSRLYSSVSLITTVVLHLCYYING